MKTLRGGEGGPCQGRTQVHRLSIHFNFPTLIPEFFLYTMTYERGWSVIVYMHVRETTTL